MIKGIRCTIFFLFLISMVSVHPVHAESNYTMMGKVVSLAKDGYNVVFNCGNGKIRVSFLTDTLVRVHMAPAGKEFPKDDLHLDENGPYFVVNYTWPGVSYEIKEEFDYDLEGEVYTIKAGKVIVKARKSPFKLAFYDSKGNLLVKEKPGIINAGLGYDGPKVYETMAMTKDEHFFGFGAHNHPHDMRGEKMVCTATELQSKDRSGGFPVPFFYSSKGYGIFFNNLDDDVTFEMGTTEGEYGFSGTSGDKEGWDMDYYFIYGPQFEQILDHYTDIVGKPMLPQKWFFGHIQCRCCDWDQNMVLDVAGKYRQGNWPCDTIIIDCQGLGENLEWTKLFPNPGDMYKHLDAMGFKTGLSTALFKDLYDWTKYDPTKKDICDEYFSLHVPRIKDGNKFFWHDNDERATDYTGWKHFANGYKAHELFGALWAKNIVEGMQAMGIYGVPVIARGGPIGGHRYVIPFAGDLAHGISFIRTDLNWLRNGSMTAYPFILVELGGFIHRGKPDMDPLEEHNVIRRLINMVAFVPISRAHGAKEKGEMLPWDLTPVQQNLYRYYLNLRYRLHPYFYSAAIEASLTGRPILAPLVFDHQDDMKTYDKDYEFMLGREILVAPVLEKTDKWDVYLPEGEWIHYWTGRKYSGPDTVTVDAPLYGKDGLPMFVRAGAIIPMMPAMNYIYEKQPEPVTLDIYPKTGLRSECVKYDCKNVKPPVDVRKTTFTCKDSEKETAITISKSAVSYELSVHSDRGCSQVTVNGKQLKQLTQEEYDNSISGYYYGAGCFYGGENVKTINIRIPKSAKPYSVIIKK
ncbi:MAG: glycoside hydrolase family 31 protein [Planctomycetota bacterium]